MIQAFVNWSGGKDASLALFRLSSRQDVQVRCLVTTLSAATRRISMHGVREELLAAQAERIGLPLRTILLAEDAGMADYDRLMEETLRGLAGEGVDHAVFGDIFLEDLRRYREERLGRVGMKGLFPLWKEDSRDLLRSFLASGFRAVVSCVNAAVLDKSFAGRVIDEAFIDELPSSVDPCGENGEFHSFVFDGPVFSSPVPYTVGDTVEKTYGGEGPWDNRFYFCDLLPGPKA